MKQNKFILSCILLTLLSAKIQAQYCVPVSTGTDCISNVTFNTLNNTTLICSPNNFLIYTNTTNLVFGQTYTLTVSTTMNSAVSAWIDWNQNLTFDNPEFYAIYTNDTLGSLAITIPVNALQGSTRLRVRNIIAGNNLNSNAACTSFGDGETEDYEIGISTVLGSSNQYISNTITLFPNPVNQILNIELPIEYQKTEKQLLNIYSQIIHSTFDKTIDVSQLPKGLYFLKCGNIFEKIIVE